MLDEAHKRGMKVHAWFNPYRVSVNTKPATIAELNHTLTQVPASVFVLHRNWIRTASDRFVLDPGSPEVRDWITSIVAEVVQNYPIDGVQFDDYFYTETPGSTLNDNQNLSAIWPWLCLESRLAASQHPTADSAGLTDHQETQSAG